MKKRIIVTALLFSAACSFTAYAGSWKENTQGWWWERDNATYPTNGWEWIDADRDGISECYYFDENGYCLVYKTGTFSTNGWYVNQ